MSVTLAEAKTEVYNSIKDEVEAAGSPAFDYDPTPGNPPRSYVAVTCGGANANDWHVAIRVYSSPSNSPQAADELATAAIQAIEDTLGADVPRSEWTPLTYDPALVMFVAETTVQVPREDF